MPGSYLAYRYTRTRIEGSLTLSDAVAPGEGAPPWPLPPGQYVARLLVDDSYRVVAQTPRFTVLPVQYRDAMTSRIEADYLVVGAGAMGMAFTDALIDHADVRVALVDRRARRRRPLARGLPVRAAAPVLHLLRRRVDGARRRADPGARARGRAARAGRPADDLRLLRRTCWPTGCSASGRVEFFPGCDVPRRPHLRLARVGRAVRGARSGAGSSTPATSPPTSRRRRRRGSRSPTARG